MWNQSTVTLVNRTSKRLKAEYNHNTVYLEPGDNQVPPTIAPILKEQFPIPQTMDDDTLTYESQLGVKEWGDDVSKLTAKDLAPKTAPANVTVTPIKYTVRRQSMPITEDTVARSSLTEL